MSKWIFIVPVLLLVCFLGGGPAMAILSQSEITSLPGVTWAQRLTAEYSKQFPGGKDVCETAVTIKKDSGNTLDVLKGKGFNVTSESETAYTLGHSVDGKCQSEWEWKAAANAAPSSASTISLLLILGVIIIVAVFGRKIGVRLPLPA